MLEYKIDCDFSEYPYEHSNFDLSNKKVLGKFKDELNGISLEIFIGLRPKCYSLLFYGEVANNIVQNITKNCKQTAKGIKESVKNAKLRHEHYVRC